MRSPCLPPLSRTIRSVNRYELAAQGPVPARAGQVAPQPFTDMTILFLDAEGQALYAPARLCPRLQHAAAQAPLGIELV